MKILITGANGMLAKAIKEEFKQDELICTDKDELDIVNKQEVIDFVSNSKPDYIINCAAYTEVDKAEENEKIAYEINSEGIKNLSIASKMNDSVLIHISTDYVFDGEKEITKTYTETDLTKPNNIYGSSKLQGEFEVQKNCEKYYIFRTSWLFGEGKNFVRTMLNLGREKEEVSVVIDEYGSPTYTVDLAKIIHQAIDKKIPYGIYHATNQGFINWNEFAKKIFEISNIKCQVKSITAKELNRKAKRPKNSKLSKEKLLSHGIIIPTYEDALIRYLKMEEEIQ